MNFPSRDLTNQLIKASYQDVLQQYTGSPTVYVLDGLGNVVFSIPSSSYGGSIVVTNLSGSSYVSNSLLFNTNPAVPPWEEGQVFWDSANHTLGIYNDQSQVTLQVGQETLVRVVAKEYIPDGSPVYISSSLNTYPMVALARATGMRTLSYQVAGISTHEILSGSSGYITVQGRVNDVNTAAYPAGTGLFLSHLASGSYIPYPPPNPYERVLCGYCMNQDATSGKILVDVVALPEDKALSVGMTNVPSFSTSSVTPTGSIIYIGTGSVNLCVTPDGRGTIKNYTLASASFIVSSSFLDAQYVCADYLGGSPAYCLETTKDTVDEIQHTLVYTVTRGAGGQISYVSWDEAGTLLANKIIDRITDVDGIQRESGLIIGESGSLYITLTSGSVWQGVKQIDLPAINSFSDRVVLIAHSASAWSGSLITQYVNDRYDDGSSLQPLTANRYVVNWVYRGIGNLNTTTVQLSNEYAKFSDAVAAQPPTPPTELRDIAILTGRAIVLHTATNAAQIDSAFYQTFTPAGITTHNNLDGLQGGVAGEYYHLSADQYSSISTQAEYRTVTASYTVAAADSIIYASASTGANVVLYMPSASTVPGQFFRIKKIDSSGYEVIISGSQNIDFERELRIAQRGSAVTLHCDATQYWIH